MGMFHHTHSKPEHSGTSDACRAAGVERLPGILRPPRAARELRRGWVYTDLCNWIRTRESNPKSYLFVGISLFS